jgi:hypothetical protein
VVTEPVGTEAVNNLPPDAPPPVVDPALESAYEALDPACKGSAIDLVEALEGKRCRIDVPVGARFDGGSALKLSVRTALPSVMQRDTVNVTVTLANPTDAPVLVDFANGCDGSAMEIAVMTRAGERIDLVSNDTAMLCELEVRRLGIAPRANASATTSITAERAQWVFVETGGRVVSPGGAIGSEGRYEKQSLGPLPEGEHVVQVTLSRHEEEPFRASTKLRVVR